MATVTKKAGGKASVPATQQRTGLVTEMPEHMQEFANRGTENLGREDLEIPRLKLIQGISPELELYNDLRAGNFLHTATERIFADPVLVVPIFIDRRYLLWNPRDSGGGILARADDGVHWTPRDTEFDVKLDKKDGGVRVKWTTAKTVQQSGLAEWGSMNPADPGSPPAATLMYSYVLAFYEEPDLLAAVLSFQRSSVKIGRALNTKMKIGRAPIFGRVFELSSVNGKNNSGQEYKVPNLTGAGFVGDLAQLRMYEEMNAGFTKSGLQIKDIEGAQGDGEAEGDNEPEEDTGKGSKNRRI